LKYIIGVIFISLSHLLSTADGDRNFFLRTVRRLSSHYKYTATTFVKDITEDDLRLS